MMRSMFSGVASLKTHQTKMDVIGNNIANVNTVAYKSQSVTFSELMYQTTQSASGPNAATGTGGVNARQIGLGVKVGAMGSSISTQGASQTTSNPFDIQITGNAFFVVSNGSENYFTRDGSFYVDAAGNLAMTSNGYNVMGWGVDEETGTIKQETVAALRVMSTENMTYPPEATSSAYVSGIIDKNDTNVTSSSGLVRNLQVYDSLGYSYTVKFAIKSTDEEGNYTVEVSSILDSNNKEIEGFTNSILGASSTMLNRTTKLGLVDGYSIDNDGGIVKTITNTDGSQTTEAVDLNNTADVAAAYGYTEAEFLKLYVTVDGTTASVKDVLAGGGSAELKEALGMTDGLESLTASGQYIQGTTLTYNPSTGAFVGVGGTSPTISLNLSNIDSKFSNIEVDFSGTTMYNNGGSSTIAAEKGNKDGLNSGRKLGEMSGISIQNNGMIYATYDNGQTRLLGQIAVQEFANASGLEKKGDNLYSATLNSGEFDGVGMDITSTGGYMSNGVLEMSNVDLSSEFTEMITTQRGFQAASRIITVSDTLLEELVNLKR
ncbi:MAG: flagellar hook protein FlgE [Lachnospiraceae bacterium]